MSPPRFYLPQLTRPDTHLPGHLGLCQITGPEAKHATAVLRLSEGDVVELFNGRGDSAAAKIVGRRKDTLDCELQAWGLPPAETAMELTLAIALPKGDRQRVLIDAVTELGVARLLPLITRRGVAQPTESALERLQRTVIEACKQCGRNRLMDIAQPVEISALDVADNQADYLRLVAHPYPGPYTLQPLMPALRNRATGVTIVIGPEGGLTDEETLALAQAGWQVVKLGDTILRIEVAAISAASQILGWYQGLNEQRN